MSESDSLNIIEQNIPPDLRQFPQWILWKLEGKTETFKGTKVPYSAKNPYLKASTTEPMTWGSFGEVVPMATLHDMTGVGYVFTEEQGIVAIDIDNCIINSSPDERARDVLSLFGGKTFIEVSHSGTGYHILTKGSLKTKRFKGIEVYTSGRYFAMTGNSIDGCKSINLCQPELDLLCEKYGEKIKERPSDWDKQKPIGQSGNIVDKLNLRVEDVGYPDNPRPQGDGEVRGAHPFHGSTTGNNYAINTHKNVWICRRDNHNSGGGPLELFAVKEGIIHCEDARPGCLDGKWKEIFTSLRKSGYDLVKAGIDKPLPPKKKKEPSPPPIQGDIHNTDFGNADRFLHHERGNLLYCMQQDSWYLWNNEGYWERDAVGEIQERVKKTLLKIYEEAMLHETIEKRTAVARWAMACEKPEHVNACLKLAQTHPDIAVRADKFDSDKYLFNMKNGTYDLQEHQLIQHDKLNYITRGVSYEYDPTTTCPHFLKFLDRIFKSRDDKIQIIEYLQKAIGYSLTGDTSQQVIFLLHGGGSNGKTTLIETLRALVGDYGTAIASKSLTTTKNDSVRNDIARLPAVRFVAAAEAPKGYNLDEELIKTLTGGDQITARFLFQEEFLFYPVMKLWWYFNHPPGIRDMTHALWRRLKLIPFNETIPEKERIPMETILNRHKEEMSGIFNWAIEGLKQYQKEGLKDIQAVTDAVKEMKDEQDVLMEFIQDICVISEAQSTFGTPDITCKASELYLTYKEWCDQNHERVKSQMWLGRELKERGINKHRTNKGYIYRGIRIKTIDEKRQMNE